MRTESESQEMKQEGISLLQIMTSQAISLCHCVETTVTIGLIKSDLFDLHVVKATPLEGIDLIDTS